MRDKPGYEHLNEPLHILVEADLPANIIDPRLDSMQDESQDFFNPK